MRALVALVVLLSIAAAAATAAASSDPTAFSREDEARLREIYRQFASYAQAPLRQANPDPDQYRNVSEIIQAKGYPCNNYNVITSDGYVLSMQNIPYGRLGPSTQRGYPVLLQHGLLDSAATWAMNRPDQSLAYILADQGFDVWLSNDRGNRYCQSNIYTSNSTDQFWEFSYDEFALIDLPARINFILKTTGYSSLSYIGHSEGTTQGFALFSSNITIANKVDLFIALAPVTYVNVTTFVGKLLADLPPEVFHLLFGKQGFMQPWNPPQNELPGFSEEYSLVCLEAICLVAGCESVRNYNSSRLPVIFSQFPSGTSVQDMLHWQQMMRDSNNFQMYNFGKWGNLQHYDQAFPPQYNISSLAVKTAVIYGQRDKLARPGDVMRTLASIPSPVFVQEIEDYGHADFVWGLDAKDKLYPFVTSLLIKYQK